MLLSLVNDAKSEMQALMSWHPYKLNQHQLRRGVADPVLMRSAMVVVGESGERGLGFPGHIGVGVARTVFEHLDHAITGYIQVQARVVAVRQMVEYEGVHEGGVNAFGGGDSQQLAPGGGLRRLAP